MENDKKPTTIVSALLAQTTFLPALLLVFGRTAFWPRPPRPGRAGRGESRIWSGIGTRVARRPVPVALAAVVLLGAACASLIALHTNNTPESPVKGRPGSVTGQQLLDAHYPPGAFDPLDVLAPPSKAASAATAARAAPGVASVTAAPPVGAYSRYSVTLSVDPYGSRAATRRSARKRTQRCASSALIAIPNCFSTRKATAC